VLLPRRLSRGGGRPAGRPGGHRQVPHALRSARAATGAAGAGDGRMSCEFSYLDGSYVLGSLSPAERLEFETHLAGCAECTREVRELAGLPGLMARVDPADLAAGATPPPPVPVILPALVQQARRVERRRTVLTVVGAAAASAAVALGAVQIWGP